MRRIFLQPVPVVAILASAALVGCGAGGSARGGPGAAEPPAVPVSVAVATSESVPVDIHAVGTVEPFSTVQVKSQIAGELTRVSFSEGADIKKGDLLFEVDARPYREALRQSQATVAKDRAQLQQSEANLGRDQAQWKGADADARRYHQLADEGMAPRTQYDQVRATADALSESIRADRAAIESARAALEGDLAAVERAKLDLSYCEIRSPVEGRAGNVLVHAGNLVKANDSTLVVVNQIRPAFVSFGVPEEYLGGVRRRSALTKLPIEVAVNDNPRRTARGYLQVIDNTVDSGTGTIKLKAVLENRDGLLWPGQFVNVTMTLATEANSIVVPAEAVQAGQQGQFVYVVKRDQTAEPRQVTVGAAHGSTLIIRSGLSAGETVVTDGQLRLFPGARIRAVPAGKIESQPL